MNGIVIVRKARKKGRKNKKMVYDLHCGDRRHAFLFAQFSFSLHSFWLGEEKRKMYIQSVNFIMFGLFGQLKVEHLPAQTSHTRALYNDS